MKGFLDLPPIKDSANNLKHCWRTKFITYVLETVLKCCERSLRNLTNDCLPPEARGRWKMRSRQFSNEAIWQPRSILLTKFRSHYKNNNLIDRRINLSNKVKNKWIISFTHWDNKVIIYINHQISNPCQWYISS